MTCAQTQKPTHVPNCCCHSSHHGAGQGMWSRKKKIRFFEARLKEIEEQKRDVEELLEELKA